MDNGPPGKDRRSLMFEFCQRALADAADFFSRGASNELDLLKQIQQEREANLEGQISEVKGDFSREKEILEKRIRDTECEKSELSAVEQGLREHLERQQQEKLALEEDLQSRLGQLKSESAREIEDMSVKLSHAEQVSQENQRKVIQITSEGDKDKALQDQKIEFLERTISDL